MHPEDQQSSIDVVWAELLATRRKVDLQLVMLGHLLKVVEAHQDALLRILRATKGNNADGN
jgi:hypothetical protein